MREPQLRDELMYEYLQKVKMYMELVDDYRTRMHSGKITKERYESSVENWEGEIDRYLKVYTTLRG